MEKIRKDELIAKYNEGLADPAEIRIIEQLIEDGEIDLGELHELDELNQRLIHQEAPTPTFELDSGFHTMLSEEKRRLKQGFRPAWPDLSLIFKPGFAVAMLVAGFAGGYWLHKPTEDAQVSALTEEVSGLKEMMMISLLQKESATERLRAVSLTGEMDKASDKVTGALFQTLNHDSNVNVRLAALEALSGYADQDAVREGLVRSITQQDSPLVQVSLADLMVALQEKKSIKEFQKLLDSDQTPKEIKDKLRKSISVLI